MSDAASAPLRLAVVRRRYAPYGGAERFIERSLDQLRGTAIEPTLICADWDGAARDSSQWEVVRLEVPSGMGRSNKELAFGKSVHAFLEAHHFDVVQSHERIPGLPIFRAGDGLHCEWLRQRARVQSKTSRWITGIDPYHRFCLKREREVFMHPALRAVICNSEMVRTEIAEYFPDALAKVRVIRNGIDLSAFALPSQRQRDATRSALGIPTEQVLFTFVGSGFERKGVLTILRAAALAPRARFLIIGHDKRSPWYQRQSQRLGLTDRVRFFGPSQDVASLLDASDVFVLPTLYDPGPNAVLEAMAKGLPILTSEKCGLSEVLVPAGAGFSHDALDASAFATSFEQLMESNLRARMGAAARGAAEQLGLEALGQNLHRLYQELRH